MRAKAGEEKRDAQRDPVQDGLIGKVELGKSPVDGELRETPDGPACGFVLRDGNTRLQVLAMGPDANALVLVVKSVVGDRVQVWGSIEYVPWKKDGKDMPPYRRLIPSRIQHAEWVIPAEPTEAPTAPLFSDDENASIDAALEAAGKGVG